MTAPRVSGSAKLVPFSTATDNLLENCSFAHDPLESHFKSRLNSVSRGHWLDQFDGVAGAFRVQLIAALHTELVAKS